METQQPQSIAETFLVVKLQEKINRLTHTVSDQKKTIDALQNPDLCSLCRSEVKFEDKSIWIPTRIPAHHALICVGCSDGIYDEMMKRMQRNKAIRQLIAS